VKLLNRGLALAVVGAGLAALPTLGAQALPAAPAGDNGLRAMTNQADGAVTVSDEGATGKVGFIRVKGGGDLMPGVNGSSASAAEAKTEAYLGKYAANFGARSGELEQAASLGGGIHDARDRGGGVLGCQPLDSGRSGLDRGGSGGAPGRRRGERCGQIFLDIAQSLEGVLLRFEQGVRFVARGDDADEGGALLLVGLGILVIELAPHAEGLGDERLRLAQRGAEALGGGRPELGLGEPELLLARRQGVVELHEPARRRLVELGH